MKYLEWNNAIGEFYFNSQKAEKDVNLFISIEDIIKIGREKGLSKKDKKIFKNFIKSIRRGIPGKPLQSNLLELALYAHQKWKGNPYRIDGVVIGYPLYIGYLVIFILPLTQSHGISGRSDAYYPKIDRFLEKYQLPKMPKQNGDFNWNILWEDLQHWTQNVKNTKLGNFELHPFQNEAWVYVGKPLSQSIFPPSAIELLPRFFQYCGLVPNENISHNYITQILLGNGKQFLKLSNKVLNSIRNEENEVGHSIINLVYKNYQDWTGNTDFYDGVNDATNKGITIGQLRLCIEGNKFKGYQTYFRLYTELDYPDDLNFKHKGANYPCKQFGKGWSKHLFLNFEEDLIVEDKLNKWIAKFAEKDVRILIEGRNFHLSGWVEVSNMVYSKMLLLVKSKLSISIEDWGKNFSEGNFIKLNAQGIPEGYSLYEIKQPPLGHPTIPSLQFKSEKRIEIVDGLKIETRTWLIDILPEVVLVNGDGSEKIYLIYEEDESVKYYLDKKNEDQPIWKLPQDIELNVPFLLKVNGLDLKEDNLKNLIVDSVGKTYLLKDSSLPGRDKFGQIIQKEKSLSFVIGSRLSTSNERPFYLKQLSYEQYFKPPNNILHKIDKGNESIFTNSLTNYLIVKREISAKEFFDVFQTLYQSSFDTKAIENHQLPLSLLKRWSINYLDYMGILDYEYSTKKILVNPPQFLFIPTPSGRKVILIGGRTEELVDKIKCEAENEDLTFACTPQDSSLQLFLLPPTITLYGNDTNDNKNIERKIARIAESNFIKFDINKYTQVRLADFSGNINEYMNQIKPDQNFIDSGWPSRIFDSENFLFKPTEITNIDKNCALVEYRLTEYNFKHRLWKDRIPYDVNKNWGRFIYLNYIKKQVFYNDRKKQMVAIPSSLPLPRLLSKALVLYSGKAPARMRLNLDGNFKWYNIYTNIPHIAAFNTCLKVGQKLQEKSFNL